MPAEDINDVDLLIVGHVATMEFFVTFPDEEENYGDVQTGRPSPERLLRKKSTHEALESRVNAEVKAALGPEFEIESVIVKRGSLEVIAAIMTVSSVVSNYNTLIEGIERAVNNTRRALSGILRTTVRPRNGQEAVQMSMTANWTRGSGLIRAETRATAARPRPSSPDTPQPAAPVAGSGVMTFDTQRLLFGYFILSHTALIAILIALLVREW